MILYVLDTDTLTLWQQGHPLISQRVAARPPGTVAITIISVEEQFLGWHTRILRAKQPDEMARVYQRFTDTTRFVAQVPILSLTLPALQRYAQLKELKLKVGRQDLRIAAIALEESATVVTCNLRDFKLVPQLTIVDWSQ